MRASALELRCGRWHGHAGQAMASTRSNSRRLLVHPLSSAWGSCRGSVQALALAAGLWFFSTKVQGSIEAQALPDAYTVSGAAR